MKEGETGGETGPAWREEREGDTLREAQSGGKAGIDPIAKDMKKEESGKRRLGDDSLVPTSKGYPVPKIKEMPVPETYPVQPKSELISPLECKDNEHGIDDDAGRLERNSCNGATVGSGNGRPPVLRSSGGSLESPLRPVDTLPDIRSAQGAQPEPQNHSRRPSCASSVSCEICVSPDIPEQEMDLMIGCDDTFEIVSPDQNEAAVGATADRSIARDDLSDGYEPGVNEDSISIAESMEESVDPW